MAEDEQIGLEAFETNWLNAEDVKAKEITIEILAKPRVSDKGKYGPQMFLDVKYDGEEYVWSPTGKGAKFLVKKYTAALIIVHDIEVKVCTRSAML